MNPWPVEAEVDEVHLPRPGHADLVGAQKYGHDDIRNVLERASARETAARVAAGSIARGLLTALGVSVHSHVTQIASVTAPEQPNLSPGGLRRGRRRPRPLPRPRGQRGDGRGDQPPAQGQREPRRHLRGARLRARPRPRLARLLGRSARRPPRRRRRLDPVGQGRLDRRSLGRRRAARLRGARRDLLVASSAATTARPTTPAALEGGMTNGLPLSVRAAIKPISTLTKPLRSVDTESKEPAQALRERTDSTVVPAAAVVAEAMVCLTLARAYREKFGGDHIDDVLAAVEAYKKRIDFRGECCIDRDRRPRAPVKPAIVFIGFMGAGKSHGAGGGARRGPGDGRDRRADRGGARDADRRGLRARRRGGVPRARGRGGRLAAGERRRRRDRARRRQRPLRAGARGARPPRRRLAAGRRDPGLAADRAQRPPAGATPRTSSACWRSGCRSTRPSPTRSCPPGTASLLARAMPSLLALTELPAATAMLWAASASGEYPGLRRAGPARSRALAAAGSALLRHRLCRRRALRAAHRAACRAASRSSPARARRRWPRPSGCCASWPQRG